VAVADELADGVPAEHAATARVAAAAARASVAERYLVIAFLHSVASPGAHLKRPPDQAGPVCRKPGLTSA
jgi:hypothetical protein